MAEIAFPDRVQSGWQSVRHARHSARAPRYLASAVLLVFLALGVRAAFFAAPAATAPKPALDQADAPSEDFALQFARAYLTYDAARPGLRARALALYIGGAQLAPDAGFSAARGSQSVRWAEVASDQRALTGGRVITVAAAVSSQRLPLYLAVTVEHPRGGPLRLAGYPSLVGAPSIASTAAPPPREPVSDPALIEVVDRVLRNYLAGAAPDLEADLAADAEVTLPTRRLRLLEVQQVVWLGAQGSGAVLATLNAVDSGGATYTLSYELGIAYRERPYVDFIEVVPTDT
jgi:hypothetical protein